MAEQDTQPHTGLLTQLADPHHRVMNQPREILTSGPVTLRRWRAADADAVYQVVMQSLEHLLPWMPWASGYSHDDAVRFTFQSEQDWESRVAYQYAITTDDAVIGSCGLMRRIGPGGLEIGYWLHPAYTGRGLATTATAALVGQAFALPDIDRVEIVHDQANTASGARGRKVRSRPARSASRWCGGSPDRELPALSNARRLPRQPARQVPECPFSLRFKPAAGRTDC